MIKRVYMAQKQKPTKGDWISLIKNDFELIEEQFNEDAITAMSKNKFKKYVKEKIEKAAFKYLLKLKNSHNKIKNIQYKKLRLQTYITSQNLTEKEIQNLFALRSRMIKVKRNFSNMYKQNLNCTFGCETEESQEHQLECESILDKLEDEKFLLAELEYADLFGILQKQEEIIQIFSKILKVREELIANISNDK